MAEKSRGVRTDVPSPRFARQKEKVLQILKNRNDFLASTTRDEDPATPRPHDPERVALDKNRPWPLNSEVMRRWSDHSYAESFRIVERELAAIRALVPFVYGPIYDLFLHEGAGDADYEHLIKRAAGLDASRRKLEEAKVGDSTWEIKSQIHAAETAVKRLAAVETSLYMLVMRVLEEDLYVFYPQRHYSPGSRGKSMEEGYREIHKVFEQECQRLSRTMKRYRKRAYRETAEVCEVSTSTVERAVHFVESVDEGDVA